ncbi:hypothetical protein EWH23_10450 [Meiothermus sp. PNK-Is4]|nr:hypothetical protein EWH23_10450 [Meiothermus sp. PNK-Is4]
MYEKDDLRRTQYAKRQTLNAGDDPLSGRRTAVHLGDDPLSGRAVPVHPEVDSLPRLPAAKEASRDGVPPYT